MPPEIKMLLFLQALVENPMLGILYAEMYPSTKALLN